MVAGPESINSPLGVPFNHISKRRVPPHLENLTAALHNFPCDFCALRSREELVGEECSHLLTGYIEARRAYFPKQPLPLPQEARSGFRSDSPNEPVQSASIISVQAFPSHQHLQSGCLPRSA